LRAFPPPFAGEEPATGATGGQGGGQYRSPRRVGKARPRRGGDEACPRGRFRHRDVGREARAAGPLQDRVGQERRHRLARHPRRHAVAVRRLDVDRHLGRRNLVGLRHRVGDEHPLAQDQRLAGPHERGDRRRVVEAERRGEARCLDPRQSCV
jgi:hypothetical protein